MPATALQLEQDLRLPAVIAGEARLSFDDALRLYHEAPLQALGRWATAMADRIMRHRYGDASLRTYVIDRNINYTNVCSANCTFCAFKRDLSDADAYTLDTEQLHKKIAELVAIGGTQVLLQGGMHPELGIEWYEDMLRGMKAAFPQVHLHAFSPPEIVEFVAVFEIDGFATTAPGRSHELSEEQWRGKLEVILRRLREAGLASIPGGGGEIFAEPVRRKIGLGKATAKQWLDVMRGAHSLGLSSSATMMFGHIEGVADRIDHMQRIRDAQDEAIEKGWPGRYVSFISWPFQRENTPLGRVPDWEVDAGAGESREAASGERRDIEPFPGDVVADAIRRGELPADVTHDTIIKQTPRFGKVVRMAGATEYLRVQAISRLFLDNVHSIGSSWVTMGPKIGQLGLFYGATDMGSVMMEENVVSAAGTTYCLNEAVLCHLIRDSGYTPAQRDNAYDIIRTHDGDDAPDRAVTDWSQHRAKKLHVESVEA